jgi:hypothetical protein
MRLLGDGREGKKVIIEDTLVQSGYVKPSVLHVFVRCMCAAEEAK